MQCGPSTRARKAKQGKGLMKLDNYAPIVHNR